MTIKLFDVSKVAEWRVASKTKGLNAKFTGDLLKASDDIASKFLIDTLEGKEPVRRDSMFCIGDAGDAWMQSSEKLLAKYYIVAITSDGWLKCEPKPNNLAEAYQTTNKDDFGANFENHGMNYIVGLWGQTVDGIKNLQAYEIGDYILRSFSDPTDVWVVRKTIFENTYVLGEVVSEEMRSNPYGDHS